MQNLLETMRATTGNEHVTTDALECQYFSQDVYSAGHQAVAVVSPADKHQLADIIKQVTGKGMAVVSRGGGMSYTGGYVPGEDNVIVLDLRRMNRVLEINKEDMYVTVEAGATWNDLHEALKPTGLRTPYWGTLSGKYATIGGGMSQNSVFFGSGHHGTAADSVIGLEVVLADGTILNTGSAAQIGALPFFRHYGPDLTGLFTSDCGAFGIKATVTLRLVPQLPAQAFASFAFETYQDMAAAMSEIARQDLAAECFGFDPYLQQQRLKRESLAGDIKKFGQVLKSAGGVGKALKTGAKLAVAGRGFMDDVKWSFHTMIEARTDASAQLCLKKVRAISTGFNGKELADSIPKLVKANPFGPVNNMLGPDGERWVPVHGLVPQSRVEETISKIEQLFSEHSELMQKHDVHTGYLLATVSTNGFVIEPVFFWPDALLEVHRRSVDSSHLKRLTIRDENLPARELVDDLRFKLIDLLKQQGAIHMQLAKSYRFPENLQPDNFALLKSIKKMLDPEGRINPGNLGL